MDEEQPKVAKRGWSAGHPVKRKTAATVFSAGKRRAVVVSIYPDGIIGLRLDRHRKEETIYSDHVYKIAVMERLAYEKAMKKKAKKK